VARNSRVVSGFPSPVLVRTAGEVRAEDTGSTMVTLEASARHSSRDTLLKTLDPPFRKPNRATRPGADLSAHRENEHNDRLPWRKYGRIVLRHRWIVRRDRFDCARNPTSACLRRRGYCRICVVEVTTSSEPKAPDRAFLLPALSPLLVGHVQREEL